MRSNYQDDLDGWDLVRWRGAVHAAMTGARGQHFLRQLKSRLEGMPNKRLIRDALQDAQGDVCALGAVKASRDIDPGDYEQIARFFGQSEALVREVMYWNDEVCYRDTPERRWERMHRWVCGQIVEGED